MLDHILATAQSFEREHGVAPNVIYLNATQWSVVKDQYPELFGDAALTEPGFQVIVLPDSVLTHPRAARLSESPPLLHPGYPGNSMYNDEVAVA